VSKKPPTAEEQKWLDKVAQMGCVVCRLSYGAFVPNEIQHLTSGGRRKGHMHTIPLCEWHHRGVAKNGMTPEYMTSIMGPSFAHSRKDFETTFGSEEYLLEETRRWAGWKNNPDIQKSSST
jgi:hypothetical protein